MTSTIEWHCLNTFLFSFPSCLTERYCYLFLCVCATGPQACDWMLEGHGLQTALLASEGHKEQRWRDLPSDRRVCMPSPHTKHRQRIWHTLQELLCVQPCLPRPSFYLLSVSPDPNLRIAPWWQTATCHQRNSISSECCKEMTFYIWNHLKTSDLQSFSGSYFFLRTSFVFLAAAGC